ncbi:MAG TPA: SpoIIE family protein phosphatase [Polyangiaceae bacterium]|nr:SpoIIE family protein phosphatase [Polyangiaceae bacterium]
MNLSIRHKLGLLAGIPIVGALLLALQIVSDARLQARKAEALGSIESLAELSAQMTSTVHALQRERAAEALALGIALRLNKSPSDADDDPTLALLQHKVAGDAQEQVRATDQSLEQLRAFLQARDISHLPPRLAGPLLEAQRRLDELPAMRQELANGKTTSARMFELHRFAIQAFVRAIAGLTDLSDDGELLRSISSLVSLLQLEERMSREHALLCHVFAQAEFPPGSYRDFVSLISELAIYEDTFRMTAAVEHLQSYDRAMATEATQRLLEMRRKALETTEEDLTVSPGEWFELGTQKLSLMAGIERTLNEQVRSAALQKYRATQRALTVSTALVAGVVLFSLIFAWFLASRVTRRVEALRDASRRIAAGDLEGRVSITDGDELGQLGGAFNDMTAKLERARAALSNQVRMARELEIAAQIQRALLPPTPSHVEFEFAGRMIPADEVGGDFYDVLSDPNRNTLWISIGDVSGHGVGAGLVMLMAQAAFASHFLRDSAEEPARVLREVNALLCENISKRLRDDKYVTAQLLTYQGDGRFSCVGAHEWPIVYRAKSGRCEVIEAPGPWLGIMSDLSDVPVTALTVEPGDVLCLYSDGITEAQNAAGELFDLARMSAVLEAALAQGKALDDVTRAVFDEVDAFSGRHEDDWTLLLVRRRANKLA